MPKLEFSQFYRYEPGADGIEMPVVLKSGGEVVDLVAYLDTGANNCLFERKHGEDLKLEIETGDHRVFRSVTGGVETFGHIVELEVLGLKVESMVYFFADERITKNLLGRIGWLDRIRLGLVDHDGELYLAHYHYPDL
jgi:hypothetical protein